MGLPSDSAARRICELVAAYYGTTLEDMRVKRRSEAVWLRAVAVQIACRNRYISLSGLARVLGLDRSSVVYLRDLAAVGGRRVEINGDLLRLVAIGRQRLRVCEHCDGTGVIATPTDAAERVMGPKGVAA